MSGVLDGVRVLDFGRFIAGGVCSLILAQMGADVIRVESPGGDEDRHAGLLAGDGETFLIKVLSYCKRSITLDMRSERGKAILRQLVARSDVVVENFSPRGAEIMGLDYDTLRHANPSIIAVSINGFGSTGPYRDRLSFDPVAQAMSGGMAQNGFPGDPPGRCAIRYVDYSTGMSAACGAIAALYDRQRTGKGRRVEVALLETALMMNGASFAEVAGLGVDRPQSGNQAYHAAPGNLFAAQDGWVYFVVVGNAAFKRFLKLVGHEELIGDARFADDMARYEQRDLLEQLANEWVAKRTVDQAVAELTAARMPAGPVYTSAEVLGDPHILERQFFGELYFPGVGQLPVPSPHINLGDGRKVAFRSPWLASSNQEVYSELLNFDDATLAELRRDGII